MLVHCCILLDFLCELYYDARIHEHQDFTFTAGNHNLEGFASLFCCLLPKLNKHFSCLEEIYGMDPQTFIIIVFIILIPIFNSLSK